MASGVKVADDVLAVYEKIRLHHSGDDQMEHLKFVKFKIEEGVIAVDRDCMIKVKDVIGEDDIFKMLISKLPSKHCCYALYDCCFTTQDSPKDELVFIMWAPEDAPVKEKLLYASSKGAIKKALAGAKHEWQLNDVEEAQDESSLLEKLAAKGAVKLLEGRKVQCGKHSH